MAERSDLLGQVLHPRPARRALGGVALIKTLEIVVQLRVGLADERGQSYAPRFAETSFKADMIRRRVMMTTETAASGGVGLGRGGRMSRKRKRDAVLRL